MRRLWSRPIAPAPRRQRPRVSPPIRFFSSSRSSDVELAYDLYPAPAPPSEGKKKKKDAAPIIVLHGLFGSKRNNRSMSKLLARDLSRPVYAIDLRNHGDSPHATPHTYPALARDVIGFVQQHQLGGATLIGHSMGAKTAMAVALARPRLVRSIVAVDNAPVDAALHAQFGGFVRGMRRVEEAGARSLKEADELLRPFAPDLAVRQFLLTNLEKPRLGSGGGGGGAKAEGKEEAGAGAEGRQQAYRWRIPVTGTLARSLDHMASFPYANPDDDGVRFDGPALFVRGRWSKYVPDEVVPLIGRFFPRFELVDVDAGHWVMSENPEAFRKVVVDFLRDKEEVEEEGEGEGEG